jgi:hypothetical protein
VEVGAIFTMNETKSNKGSYTKSKSFVMLRSLRG